MSLLISTPCYGGMCTTEYLQSCLYLKESLTQQGLKHDFLITTNESLVTRARNACVAKFLQTDYERLMFIDADISFHPDDVAKLWNLDVDVAVGAYRMKRPGTSVTAWVKEGNLDLVKVATLKEPTPVEYAGTGFMMIKRKVFETLKSEKNYHEEGSLGDCWAFFDTGVIDDGQGPFYCSEDYWFCREWRKHGKILLDPSITLGHVGRQVYE